MERPLFIESLPYTQNSTKLFEYIRGLDHPVWLDSGKPAASLSRYDVLTAEPIRVLDSPNYLELNNAQNELGLLSAQSTAQLKELELPFVTGVLGFFDYEANHREHGLAPSKRSSTALLIDQTVVVDHRHQRTYFCSTKAQPCASLLYKAAKAYVTEFSEADKTTTCSFLDSPDTLGLVSDHDQTAFEEKIETIHEYILAGDAYQINFSQQYEGKITSDSYELYLACREKLAAPYSCFAQLGHKTVLSFSPERLVSAQDRRVKTQPIKGTIRRGENDEEDQILANELANSDKDRAENVMIVDLLRNDFSRSCEPHSVEVTRLFELKSFQNVHHLISTIEGTLQQGKSLWEFFFHCFPGGSITGAPKRRAMEIIAELERRKRGIYCGSIAYQNIDGRFDSNIAIRTIEIEGSTVRCAGGAGITIDSDPTAEYHETLQKIAPLVSVLKGEA